jgi:protein SCO1
VTRAAVLRAGLLLAALLLGSAPRAQALDLTDLAFTQKQGTVLPLSARFRDGTGQERSLGAFLDGKPAVLALGYYNCPNLCGTEREDMLQALSESGLATPDDYTLIFASIDPTETVQAAAQAERDDLARHPTRGAERGWHFLVGSPDAVRALAEATGFHARYDTQLKQYLHPIGLVFATPAGTVSGYVLGVGYGAGDVRQAVRHAAAGERVSASPILLLCFHYDSTTGRYTLAVEKLLRFGAALTVLTLGTALAMAHLRRRQ